MSFKDVPIVDLDSLNVGLVCVANMNLCDTITIDHLHADPHSNEMCINYVCFERSTYKQMKIPTFIE